MSKVNRDTPVDEDGVPHRVASFEIRAAIGRGGMGCVYRAEDLKLQRLVALKRPRPELLDRPDFRDRFLVEARTASQLLHPNITTVFEVLEEDGVPWLVMELIEGETLRMLLRDRKPLPFEDVLKQAEGLADALRLAHSQGILHRDISPNNILIGGDGRAKLTDFGLARAHGSPISAPPEASTVTQPMERIAGTRGYMSPEQVLGRAVDARSDIFCLGAVLYEMCTGRPAFAWADENTWVDAVLHHEPEPASRISPDVPREFDAVLRKACAKRPFQRYQSANEMLLDIRALQRKLNSAPDQSWPPRERPRRLVRPLVLASAVVLATLIATAALLPRWWAPSADQYAMVRHRRLTASPGWEGQPALSPDGRLIAYVSDEGGTADIWIVAAAGGEPMQLTHDPAAETHPAWMADGATIVFTSDREGEVGIWRTPAFGGSPVRMLPNARDPAPSRDGANIAFARPEPSGRLRIWVAPLDDLSRAWRITGPENGIWDHHSPAWSPDGTALCYADYSDLWLVDDLRDARPRRLTSGGVRSHRPVWSEDGRRIYFSSMRDGGSAIWSIEVSGGAPERLTAGIGGEAEPSLDSQGKLIAYATLDSNPDIVLRDRRTGEETEIAGVTVESEPAFSPDGSTLAFHSDRRERRDLWLQLLDDDGRPSGAPRQLTSRRGSSSMPSFSPDGSWIAFHRAVDGNRDIWMVPAEGGVERRITDHPGVDIQPSFSPDGSRIAFVSDRSGVHQIWVIPVSDGLAAGDAWQVTAGGEAHLLPAWSPDGSRIAAVAVHENRREACVVDLRAGSVATRLTSGAGAVRLQWEGSGEALLVSGTWGSDRVTLRELTLADRSSRGLEPEVDLGPDDPIAGLFAVGRDDRLLAYVRLRRTGDIWLAQLERAGR